MPGSTVGGRHVHYRTAEDVVVKETGGVVAAEGGVKVVAGLVELVSVGILVAEGLVETAGDGRMEALLTVVIAVALRQTLI